MIFCVKLNEGKRYRIYTCSSFVDSSKTSFSRELISLSTLALLELDGVYRSTVVNERRVNIEHT